MPKAKANEPPSNIFGNDWAKTTSYTRCKQGWMTSWKGDGSWKNAMKGLLIRHWQAHLIFRISTLQSQSKAINIYCFFFKCNLKQYRNKSKDGNNKICFYTDVDIDIFRQSFKIIMPLLVFSVRYWLFKSIFLINVIITFGCWALDLKGRLCILELYQIPFLPCWVENNEIRIMIIF